MVERAILLHENHDVLDGIERSRWSAQAWPKPSQMPWQQIRGYGATYRGGGETSESVDDPSRASPVEGCVLSNETPFERHKK